MSKEATYTYRRQLAATVAEAVGRFARIAAGIAVAVAGVLTLLAWLAWGEWYELAVMVMVGLGVWVIVYLVVFTHLIGTFRFVMGEQLKPPAAPPTPPADTGEKAFVPVWDMGRLAGGYVQGRGVDRAEQKR